MDKNKRSWIGVDFDGTLSTYYGWNDPRNGKPIKIMVDRVKKWLEDGKVVKIMTARVSSTNLNPRDILDQRAYLQDWCEKHIGKRLEITCEKDHLMEELWDDRARRVIFNRGMEYSDSPSGYVRKVYETAEREFKETLGKGALDKEENK